jgi:hypothetical protein
MTAHTQQEAIEMPIQTTGGCCGSSCTCSTRNCNCSDGACRKPGRVTDAVTLRSATADDATALRRLAILDSARPLSGETLVAELDGRLIAAISADRRAAIGDPFVPTARVIELLRGWSAQAQVAA